MTACIWVSGCTYNGHVRRGIYPQHIPPERLDASVLLLPQRYIPPRIVIADPDAPDTQTFTLHSADGVMVAVTDALGSLFTRADAGDLSLQDGYDYRAEVLLETNLTNTPCDVSVPANVLHQEGLCTKLNLSLFKQGQTQPFLTAIALRWRPFRTPGFASSVRWLNKHTRIFFPLLTPIYIQAQGNAVKTQFENNLKDTLEDIIFQLKQSLVPGQTQEKKPSVQTEGAQNTVKIM